MAKAKAKTRTTHLLSLLFTLSLLPAISPSSFSSSSPDSFIFAGCTPQKYSLDSPNQSNLNSLLTSFLNSATYSSYNNFTVVTSAAAHEAISGLYQCRGDLPMPHCSACISHSIDRLAALCPSTCGAAIQLDGCFLKYDNASFVGIQDKTVILKKCGPSLENNDNSNTSNNDVDGVLSGLSSSGGAFRVGGSGNVQGVAQCTGDLEFQECQDCVSEAIRRLKNDCGDAAAYGDVFLGKCYVRYSVGGAHPYSSKAHSKSKNGGEKTFAIIIGLLAGIAILVIFLAFLRRICSEGHGK